MTWFATTCAKDNLNGNLHTSTRIICHQKLFAPEPTKECFLAREFSFAKESTCTNPYFHHQIIDMVWCMIPLGARQLKIVVRSKPAGTKTYNDRHRDSRYHDLSFPIQEEPGHWQAVMVILMIIMLSLIIVVIMIASSWCLIPGADLDRTHNAVPDWPPLIHMITKMMIKMTMITIKMMIKNSDTVFCDYVSGTITTISPLSSSDIRTM